MTEKKITDPIRNALQGNKLLNRFEKLVIDVLTILMCIVIALSIVDLGANLITQFLQPPFLLLDVNRLLDTFGLFLLILIGLELLETVKTYVLDRIIHVEHIFMVGMIAIARKITIFDIDKSEPLWLAVMGIAILALSAAFFLFKYANKLRATKDNRSDAPSKE